MGNKSSSRRREPESTEERSAPTFIPIDGPSRGTILISENGGLLTQTRLQKYRCYSVSDHESIFKIQYFSNPCVTVEHILFLKDSICQVLFIRILSELHDPIRFCDGGSSNPSNRLNIELVDYLEDMDPKQAIYSIVSYYIAVTSNMPQCNVPHDTGSTQDQVSSEELVRWPEYISSSISPLSIHYQAWHRLTFHERWQYPVLILSKYMHVGGYLIHLLNKVMERPDCFIQPIEMDVRIPYMQSNVYESVQGMEGIKSLYNNIMYVPKNKARNGNDNNNSSSNGNVSDNNLDPHSDGDGGTNCGTNTCGAIKNSDDVNILLLNAAFDCYTPYYICFGILLGACLFIDLMSYPFRLFIIKLLNMTYLAFRSKSNKRTSMSFWWLTFFLSTDLTNVRDTKTTALKDISFYYKEKARYKNCASFKIWYTVLPVYTYVHSFIMGYADRELKLRYITEGIFRKDAYYKALREHLIMIKKEHR